MTDGSPPNRSPFLTIAWGLFCACSWTWCIGMYLPLILLDRYGWSGFAAFFVPNVLGCAAMGYVIRSRARSERLVNDHRSAALWFSVITISYHMFFAVFLITEITADSAHLDTGELTIIALPALLAMAALYGAGWLISFLGNRSWLILATATFLLSSTLFVIVALKPSLLADVAPTHRLTDVAWLAPILVFGFLLCPYLDLTFHRAAQHSPSRHAFFVFGVAFLVMIVFTCFMWNQAPARVHWPVLVQLGAQGVFTVGAHLREIRASNVRPTRYRRFLLGLPWIAGLAFLTVKMLRVEDALGEATYLRFLVFYGLVFPAYVLLFVGPWRPLTRTGRSLALYAGVVIVMMPLYELGFIRERMMFLAVPAAAIVLWAIARQRRGNPEQAG